MYYCKGLDNFGDELSVYIVEKLSQKSAVFANSTDDGKLVAIGSLLTYDVIHSDSVIWGTGTLTKNAVKLFPKVFPLTRSLPTLARRLKESNKNVASIRAVRGPLTRKALIDAGISCPEIYGDPAIVMPRIYHPKPTTKSKVGLILHYSQERLFEQRTLNKTGRELFKLISIKRQGNEQLESFIDEVCSCEKIFSTSLHGLIIAQTYGIPAQWMRAKGTAIHSDETHKFIDYFLGVGLPPQTPLFIDLKNIDIQALSEIEIKDSQIDNSVVDAILSVFPK